MTAKPGMRLNFELTNLCNLRCIHCLRERGAPGEYLSVCLVEKVLAEMQSYSSFELVSFGGGEPTLHPGLDTIIGLVTRHGYRFAFVTNGWQFQETFRILRPYLGFLEGISFSLDGANEASHDALRLRPGSFRQVIQAIVLSRSQKIASHINMVVTKANRTELEDMASLASHLGCCILDFAHCQPTPDAVAAGLVLNSEERQQVEADIAELQRIYRMKIRLAGDHHSPLRFYQCPQLRMEELNVDYRGRLTLCCMLSNYRGGTPDTDVIADLNEVSLAKAHLRLISTIAELQREKVTLLNRKPATKEDSFICTHCLIHFKKVPDIRRILEPSRGVGT